MWPGSPTATAGSLPAPCSQMVVPTALSCCSTSPPALPGAPSAAGVVTCPCHLLSVPFLPLGHPVGKREARE